MAGGNLTLGSLFDGSGTFPLGAKMAGIEPVWSSEIELFPIRVTTKRLPSVKHYGDIHDMDGGKIEPVDIITFGSPCTDMSIAGKRAGLKGKQSCLFYEAIRIIKEMRRETDGRKPRYIIWENVTGSFSSSKGHDFQSVLTEVARAIEPEAPEVPMPEKGWPSADTLLGDGWSIAYRVFDSQGWGVPQRRRRVYLVADFGGGCAGKILFDTEGLLGDSASCFRSWQGTAGRLASCLGASGGSVGPAIVLGDQGGCRMDVSEEVTGTLRAHGNHPPLVYENHSMDTRYTGPLEVAPTVSATYGTGGNNQPLVTQCEGESNVVSTVDIRLTSEGTRNARHNVYETEIARCLDTAGATPDCNQGGVAIVERHEAYTVTPGGYTQVEREKSPTLMARDYKDPTAVCCGIAREAFNAGAGAKFAPSIDEELQPPMTASGPGAVQQGYAVRRLTPTECARLQGFPDGWCKNLGTENPTEEEMAFWREVFETHRKVMGTSKKPKTDRQIRKWLENPHSDSAEYRMWGNGCTLPVVYYILRGIALFHRP